MKENKQLMVMTAMGPVPFDAIKDYVSKEVADLVKEFTLHSMNAEDKDSVPVDVDYYISNMAKKAGWKFEKMVGTLTSLASINRAAVFSMLLREVAVELDKKYKDHINNCAEIYIISTLDGRIHKMPRAYIKNFRNFSAFRTEKDAKIACRILRDVLKAMFSNGGK